MLASSSKKTRRPVIRSISWKRSKKTKMEEADNHSVEESVEVDSGRRFAKREGSHEISDYEDDEVSDVDPSGPSSKKRKRFGMWKVVKRFFGRKSGKGSKSFTEGESSTSKSQPARSLSDPNLMRRIDRPELAPFEQVDKQPLQTKPLPPVPKKALSVSNNV